MQEKFLQILAILILIIFIIPVGIKDIHHHDHEILHKISALHFDLKCSICDYNSILFPETKKTISGLKILRNQYFASHYIEIFISDFNSQFYLLRAPPLDIC